MRQCSQLLLDHFEPFVIGHCRRHLIGLMGVQRIDFDHSVSLFVDNLFFVPQQFAPEHEQGQNVQHIRFAGLCGEPLKQTLQRVAGNLPLRRIVGDMFCR